MLCWGPGPVLSGTLRRCEKEANRLEVTGLQLTLDQFLGPCQDSQPIRTRTQGPLEVCNMLAGRFSLSASTGQRHQLHSRARRLRARRALATGRRPARHDVRDARCSSQRDFCWRGHERLREGWAMASSLARTVACAGWPPPTQHGSVQHRHFCMPRCGLLGQNWKRVHDIYIYIYIHIHLDMYSFGRLRLLSPFPCERKLLAAGWAVVGRLARSHAAARPLHCQLKCGSTSKGGQVEAGAARGLYFCKLRWEATEEGAIEGGLP